MLSAPNPASLKTAMRTGALMARAGSPPIRPPCDPVITILPASLALTSEAESSSSALRPCVPMVTVWRVSACGFSVACGCGAFASSATALATAIPVVSPKRSATRLTVLITPRSSVSLADPIWQLLQSAPAAAMPTSARANTPATPARSNPMPASLNKTARAPAPEATAAGYIPPCDPLTTICPAVVSVASVMESSNSVFMVLDSSVE